jgi:hypothetical protein
VNYEKENQAMPMSTETILEANRKMLGKTNRAILFAKANLDEWLDPDVPEEDREYTPTLATMLANINEMSEEQFLSQVRDKLTVTSFREFLDKFQPGFYYRVAPGAPAAAGDGSGEVLDAGEGTETADAATEGTVVGTALGAPPPTLEFSLEGGPGFKKVRITMDHPYIRCLSDLIKKRVRQDQSTFRVDVDASLFTYKPKNQRALMRKMAEDVQVKNDRLMLEAKRNPGSPDTKRALEAYRGVADEFQNALEDSVRVLPTVVYGLAETSKALKKLPSGAGPIDTTIYQIEFGKNRMAIASPSGAQKRALEAAAKAKAQGALAAGAQQAAALGAGVQEMAALAAAEGESGLATSGASETGLATTQGAAKTTALARPSLDKALDTIRDKAKEVANVEIALVPQEKRFPIALGKFMDKMIAGGMMQPLMGNLIATVLQNPKELVMLGPDITDVDFFHDMFLSIYTNAVEDFLKTVTPLFETIMGVYLLFNEFPIDVRLPDSLKPELIIANADLPDLFVTRKDELKRFFEVANAQAANQFRDAISFVIVPNVAPFARKRPQKKSNKPSIMLDDPLLEQIQAAQAAATGSDEGYGKVTFVDEMTEMMEWGHQYFFQVLFSPEERVRAGRAQRDFFAGLADAYAQEFIVDKEAADALILCLPDFTLMPPDGKLVTGRTADGEIEVGADVPELTVRSCYVAAGRLMANDVPAYLQRKLQKAKKDPTSMRMDLSGVGIDLATHPFLGETDLPMDHFLNDGIISDLLAPDMPFLVFTHVAGRSPFLSVPRTMRRLNNEDGTQSYRQLHLFRQQAYLNRLLRAAHELGFGGAFPSDNAQAEAFISEFLDYIIKWTKWYDPTRFVNSFPSKLQDGNEYSVRREVGNQFKIAFGFEQGLIAEFGISF